MRVGVATLPCMAGEAPLLPEPGDLVRLGVRAALLDGDPGLAFRMLADLMAEGATMDEVLFEVIAPVQRDVGERWYANDYRIAEEHAASAAVETVVSLLAGSFDMPPDGTRVVVACVEGETHSLPARMVAAHLVSTGHRVQFLGSTLPAKALGQHLAEDPPDALLLSCTAMPHLLGVRAAIREAHAVGVPVVVGGRAFGGLEARASALGADAFVEDPTELSELLAGWSPDTKASEGEVVERPEAHELDSRAASLTEAVVAANPGMSRRDLGELVGTTVAALLIDDPAPLHELVAWHRNREATSGAAGIASMVEALLAAGLDGTAADLLRSAAQF